MTPPLRVLIDTDPGIDDVVTLALAARSPELDIVAVTTTYGNATLDAATRNAREALRLAGRGDVAVRPGANRPLRRPLTTAPETHGDTGVGYARVPPAEPVSPNEHVLLDLLRRERGEVTLVTLGPLTNLARALEADPAVIRRRVARHVGMFGNLRERGNTTRWADFNAWCDPEAAAQVIAARLPTDMVGLDVTRRMTLSAAEVARLRQAGDGPTRWLGEAMQFYVEFHRAAERLDGCVVNDVLTVADLIDPGLLTFATHRLVVDLDEGAHRGHTREQPGGAAVRVAVDVDVRRARRLLGRVFGSVRWEDERSGGAEP